jgi:hypothetical protein
VSYNRIAVISLTPCPKGDNMVVIRYYKVDANGLVKRKEILSVRKKVQYIDEEILLFFANGGHHSR